MSVNKFRPHVYVIPEDDANRQIADWFVIYSRFAPRRMQVVEPAGGWSRVLDTFMEEYLPLLQRKEAAHVVMLIDFDGAPEVRRARFEAEIPEAIRNRVFVVGPRDTPESLKKSFGTGYEDIGRLLAEDCDRDRKATWDHELLKHNETDRHRFFQSVKAFLYD